MDLYAWYPSSSGAVYYNKSLLNTLAGTLSNDPAGFQQNRLKEMKEKFASAPVPRDFFRYDMKAGGYKIDYRPIGDGVAEGIVAYGLAKYPDSTEPNLKVRLGGVMIPVTDPKGTRYTPSDVKLIFNKYIIPAFEKKYNERAAADKKMYRRVNRAQGSGSGDQEKAKLGLGHVREHYETAVRNR